MIAVSARRKNQRGDAILESALCFLPMMALFFGIVDVCFAVSIQSLFSQATRAGSRWAITYSAAYNGSTCASQSACIANVVQDNAVGFLAGAKINYLSVNYYISNNLNTPVMTCNAGTCTPTGTPTLPYTYTPAGSPNPVTINYANQTGNVVEVTIPAYPLLWMVPIVGYGGFGVGGYSAGNQVTDLSGRTGLGLTLSASAVDVLGDLPVGATQPAP